MAFASLPAVRSVIFNLLPTPLWFSPQGKGKGTWGGKLQDGKGYASTWRTSPYGPSFETKGGKQGGKASANGKGFGKPNLKGQTSSQPGPRVPKLLLGLHYRHPCGKPICFGFNLPGGCSQTTDTNATECDRGMHVCSKCLGSHSYNQCPQKP